MKNQSDLRKKIEDYSYGLTDLLHDGHSSKVYKGIKENTKETVAIKVIDIKAFKSKNDKKALEVEIQVLRKLNHPNILRCLDVYSTFNNCYIITEYCQGGDFKTLLRRGRMEEAEAMNVFRDIYRGYKYLFSKGFTHRNIDPTNILLKNGQCKLGDFGTASKDLDNAAKYDVQLSTSPYRSPEAINSGFLGPKCDIWSLGVILYETLHGRLPFENTTSKDNPKNQIQFDNIPKDAMDLIQKCLITENLRITMTEVESHPFVERLMSSNNTQTVRDDYQSVPLTKVMSNIQNHPASQIDRIKDLKNNKGQNVVVAQIALMRYLFRVYQLLPKGKLQFLVIKQLLSTLEALKMCVELLNPYQADYIHDFFLKEKSLKAQGVIHEYVKKYSRLHQELKQYVIKGTKDRRLLNYLDNNLGRSQGLVTFTINYCVDEIKLSLSELKDSPNYKKLQDEDTLPKELQAIALRLDYVTTLYQLNSLCVSNWNDLSWFSQVSKVDRIVNYQPSEMQKLHVRDLEKKIKDLDL